MPDFTYTADEERVYLYPTAFVAEPGHTYTLDAAPDDRFTQTSPAGPVAATPAAPPAAAVEPPAAPTDDAGTPAPTATAPQE